MNTKTEKVLRLIRSYGFKKKSPFLLYGSIRELFSNYAEKRNDEDLKELLLDEREKLRPILQELNDKGYIKLIFRGDRIDSIELPSFYKDYLAKKYGDIENDPSIPFPGPGNIDLDIPEDLKLTINVKTDLVAILSGIKQIEKPIIKINFPEDIESLFVPREYIKTRLMQCAVLKVHLYLQDTRNSGFIYNKLIAIMQKQEVLLNEMMNSIVTKPGKALNSLINPTSIGFKFWAHLASFILQDFKDKAELLAEEIGYCQSAYLIGFFVVYQKGLVQKALEKKEDLNNLELQIKKPPYAFTFSDLYELKDKHGIKYTKKYSREFIHQFLEKKSVAKDKDKLPEVLRLKGSQNKEYFIHRDLILPLFLEKVSEAANELKVDILESWVSLMREDKKSMEMKSDEYFLKFLIGKIKNEYPLLTAITNPNLLYIAKEELQVDYPVLEQINGFFNKDNKLKPINVIMGLYRKELLKEAKSALPFWQTMPFIKGIVKFFKKLFRKKTKKEISGLGENLSVKDNIVNTGKKDRAISGRNDKEAKKIGNSKSFEHRYENLRSAKNSYNRIRYVKAMKELKEEIVGKGVNINIKLKELAEKWNPLYDPIAKKNLVEDVNALIRDYLRSLKKGFKVQPPDAERIRNLAAQLVKNKNLAKIKKKHYLEEYIAIYMIKYLSAIK